MIDRAIKFFGNQEGLAQAAGVSQSAISQARKSGKASAELSILIEKATGGAITRNDLRPDLFGAADATTKMHRKIHILLKTLKAAETFIAGFEDDDAQEDLSVLTEIRAAIAEAEKS